MIQAEFFHQLICIISIYRIEELHKIQLKRVVNDSRRQVDRGLAIPIKGH